MVTVRIILVFSCRGQVNLGSLGGPMVDRTEFVTNLDGVTDSGVNELLGNLNRHLYRGALGQFRRDAGRQRVAGAVNSVGVMVRFTEPEAFARFE